MPIDRKAYKADKKKYKKEGKAAKSEFKETGFSSMGNPFAPKRSDYKEKSPTSGYRNYPNTDKETKNKDIMMNPGSPPKSAKKRRAKKAYARSVSGGPRVMREETRTEFKPNTDDNENIGRGGKGPKPMSRTRRAKASVMKLKDGLVSRFQSSTPKIGKNELMKPVLESLTQLSKTPRPAYTEAIKETAVKKK